MREYLRNLVNAYRRGLATVQVPTGTGKSYEAAVIIKELAENPEDDRKLICLTSLNKNLLDKDLAQLYGEDKNAFDTQVLRIRSNRDEVLEKIMDLEVPETFQTEKYVSLIGAVKVYRRANDSNVRDKAYISDLEKKVDDSERAFRKELTKRLERDFRKKEDRLAAIQTNDEYKWIGVLYPAVFTDEYQVLVMSVSKFLKRNSVIVEKSYEFLKADFIDNAIIIIDEFDSTKKVIMNDIIERALNMKNDYISLFRQIKRTFVMENMSRNMSDAANSITGNITVSGLIEECDDIWNRYSLGLSYKVAERDMDRSQNFLVKDGTFHSILQNGAQYIRVAREEAENRVQINFEKKADFYANRSDEDIVIYSMLRDISTFLNRFRILIYAWGERYAEIVNAERRERNTIADEMSIDSAIDSIMAKLELGDKQRQIIRAEICGAIVNREIHEMIPDNSFYQKGMEVFSFKDHDDHNDYTELEFVQVLDTPEKVLAYLAEKAFVIGISATAELPSVVSNYDLKYLKNDVLGDRYISMDTTAVDRIKAELEKKWEAYSDGRISIHAEIIKNLKGGFDLDEVCGNIFINSEYGEIAANKIRERGVTEYYQMRYCNILNNMYTFMSIEDIQSALYLGMALPRRDSDEMSEELFHIFERLIIEDLHIKDIERFIFILSGDNFDEDKERLIKRLEMGEKLYILSSYQTIGAGQNLQYRFKDKDKLVELVPYMDNGDKRHFTKDIDAIYLGEVTNKSINIGSDTSITDEELLNMLFQIEELYCAGEINFRQMEDAMKSAFSARQGKKSRNLLNKTRSVQLIATGNVLQAVGRICRTHMKSRNIYIWIDESLVDSLDARELSNRILPPEMKAIANLKSKLGQVYSDDEKIKLNIAEKVSSDGNWWIHQRLSRNWTESSMNIWREVREISLRHPTADEQLQNENAIIRKMYITSGSKINRYLYSQYSDFSDVTIDFGNDEIAFRNSGRAKHKGESEEFIVSKVSAEDSKLYAILRYPGMKEYFEEHGYATDFVENDYIMSPVIFHNIYKGALGETAGKFILSEERGIVLNEIDEPERFEYFDFEMAPNVYVDFKNWKFTYAQDREKTLMEISRKLDKIGAKRVYIINVVADNKVEATTSIDKRIIEIPGLIDREGHIIVDAFDKIVKEDYES